MKNKCEFLKFFIVEAATSVVTMEMKTVNFAANKQAVMLVSSLYGWVYFIFFVYIIYMQYNYLLHLRKDVFKSLINIKK